MPSRVTMLEDLLRSDLLAFINSNRAGNLPEWSTPAVVIYEDIPDKFFDIRDVKNVDGSIKCDFGNGEASYFNGDEGHSYLLRFIRYEEFVNQFRIHQADGSFQDWTRGWSRPDYMAYDISENKRCFIIHELSSGDIRSKHKDGKMQLLKTVVALCKIPSMKQFFNTFAGRCFCFLSARGCVDATPMGMADSFMDIYNKLPNPLPIDNKSITNRGFLAFETKVVKL